MEEKRYRTIIKFFFLLIGKFIFWDIFLPKIGCNFISVRKRSARLRQSAIDFRRLAVEMGGVLIKVGQFLSTRVDILPAEITDELEGLQDEVPPENFESIKNIIEEEFGKPLEYLFAVFDRQPLAAASLGQVHLAKLLPDQDLTSSFYRRKAESKNEWDVVVKVQRPTIEKLIKTDLAALRTIGRWIQHYPGVRKRVDVLALLNEFSSILYQEIDYINEGNNAETFAENFQNCEWVQVPEVVWRYTTRRVLTLENVLAIKITDYEAIDSSGVRRNEVASRLLDTYLQQIFEDGFFHADPHPGNLFVLPWGKNENEVSLSEVSWKLTFVDFGMVGKVPQNMLEGLREMLIAIGIKDANRLVKAYETLGVLLPDVNKDLLAQAEAKIFERFWGKSMGELQNLSTQEIRDFAYEFRELIYTFPFQVPHDLIFLARAVGILSGICTGLDPNFNVWNHIAPYAQKLIANQSFRSKLIIAEVKKWLESILGIPGEVHEVLSQLNQGKIEVQSAMLSKQIKDLELAVHQLTLAVIFGVCLFLGVYMVIMHTFLPGALLLGVSLIVLIWIILIIIRNANK